MIPNPGKLLEKLELKTPVIGLYDAPDAAPFEPLVEPEPRKHECLFRFYENWKNGQTLLLTVDNCGCGGCGKWLFGRQNQSRDEFISFLVDKEGLKESHELMEEWVDSLTPYQPAHHQLFVGPLREAMFPFLKTVTFFVNLDQLSALMIGANYKFGKSNHRAPVVAPFGSGCMELLPIFNDITVPQAVIGGTDMAMRQFLPRDILAFTMTIPMYSRLCELPDNSFLNKPFLKNLKRERGSLS